MNLTHIRLRERRQAQKSMCSRSHLYGEQALAELVYVGRRRDRGYLGWKAVYPGGERHRGAGNFRFLDLGAGDLPQTQSKWLRWVDFSPGSRSGLRPRPSLSEPCISPGHRDCVGSRNGT